MLLRMLLPFTRFDDGIVRSVPEVTPRADTIGLRMSIEIHDNRPPDVSQDVAGAGRVNAWAPVRVTRTLPSGMHIHARESFALRWENPPDGARLSQVLSLRAFFLGGDGRVEPVSPSPPHTDVRPGYGGSFVLSGQETRTWHLDAAPETQRRDLGRAYVSDESYGFSEREPNALEFYDGPTLGTLDPVAAREENGIAAADAPRYELIGLFLTQAWVGRRLLGMVEWSRIWTYPINVLTSVTTSSEGRYPQPPSWTHRRNEGPTRAESLRLVGRWQRMERRRRLAR